MHIVQTETGGIIMVRTNHRLPEGKIGNPSAVKGLPWEPMKGMPGYVEQQPKSKVQPKAAPKVDVESAREADSSAPFGGVGGEIAKAASDDSSSGSSSDSSDDDDKEISTAEGLADAATDADVARTCEWFKQDLKIHLTAERSMDGRSIPFCRIESGKPFRCDARVSGTGADDAMEAGDICTRCMSRGPRAIKDYISHASI